VHIFCVETSWVTPTCSNERIVRMDRREIGCVRMEANGPGSTLYLTLGFITSGTELSVPMSQCYLEQKRHLSLIFKTRNK
jgi:hypothetical protein